MGVEGGSQYDYRSVYSLAGRPLSSVVEKAFTTFATLPNGALVLDLGSGDGRLPQAAPKPRNFHFLAVDLSPEAVAKYQDVVARDGRLDEAVIGDITDLSFVGNREIRGAISWRVIHALDPTQQLQVLDQLRQILPVGSPVFLAVYSDQDWKANELRAQNLYNTLGLNNCAGIMELQQDKFGLYFFNPSKIQRLATDTGFITRGIESFEEPTGYDHLRARHPNNKYLFVHLERAG